MAELVIQNPSITSGDFSFSGDAITAIAGHPVAGVGGGGTQSDYVYVPSFNDQTGDITFTLDTTASEGKGPWHISGAQGPQGPQGPSGTNGKDAPIPEFQINSSNAHWEWKYTNESDWTDLNVVASGAVGPQGIQGIQGPSGAKGDTGAKGADATPLTADTTTIAGGTQVTISYTSGGDPLAQFNVLSGAKGADGQKGADGYSPTITLTPVTDASHNNGGTQVEITYKNGESTATTAYTAWNGNDGAGATVNLVEGDGIQITKNGTDYTIGVSADYALKSELPDVTDMATKTWVGDQGFLKAVPAEYATKTYANDASAYALSQAETYADSTSAEALSQAMSWTNQQNFATSAGLDADKLFAMTRTGWSDFTIPSTSGYLPLSGGTVSGQLTISGNDFNNNLHLKRGNYEGYIGLAGNGAITLKNAVNGSTSQIEFLTSDNKTFDITVKDSSPTPQPVGKLYVMSAHSFADASATSANWANDGMLHIILDS